MAEQLMLLLDAVAKPEILLSLTLSEIVISPEDDPTFASIMGRVLYHSMLRVYHVNGLGKYCIDSAQFDLLYAKIRQFSGNYEVSERSSSHVSKT